VASEERAPPPDNEFLAQPPRQGRQKEAHDQRVFRTKERVPSILMTFGDHVHAYLGGIIRGPGCVPLDSGWAPLAMLKRWLQDEFLERHENRISSLVFCDVVSALTPLPGRLCEKLVFRWRRSFLACHRLPSSAPNGALSFARMAKTIGALSAISAVTIYRHAVAMCRHE
jgi:hypothetical protein